MGEVVAFERVGPECDQQPRRLLNARDVAQILQVSEAMAYRLLQTEIATVRMGRSVRCTQGALQAFIAGRETVGSR